MNDEDYGVGEIFENEATGLVKELYIDIKNVLKVPMVNFIFRTLASYKDFLKMAWEQVRLNMLTINMKNAADKLRYPNISVSIPKIDWESYYNHRTIEKLRKTIFTFNYVNSKLLLIASAWAESLSNRPILGETKVEGFVNPGIISSLPELNLIHIPNAKPLIKQLLLDIVKKHHAFDAASDFRALANYPEFLSLSWNYLRSYVGSEEYNIISSNLISDSINYAHEMPYAVTINRKSLEQIYSNKEITGIMGIVSMFQNFLPPLIIDGEFFKRIIE